MNESEILKCIETVNNSKGRERDKAMAKIMDQFQPYMYKAVARMDPNGGEDAMSAAIEGLYHAVSKFKPESGNQFFTYAYNCISGYIGMALRDGRLIRLTNSELKHLRKKENRDEYARRSNFISLNNRNMDGEGREMEEYVAYNENYDIPDEEEEAKKAAAQKKADEILKSTIFNLNGLPNKDDEPTHKYDGAMFRMMYGILGSPKYTVKEIVQKMKDDVGIEISESTVCSRCRSIMGLVREKMKFMGWSKSCVTFAWLNNRNIQEGAAEEAVIGPLFGGPEGDMPKDYVPDMSELGINVV